MQKLFELFANNIDSYKTESGCVTVGIDGLDCSGKTYLAKKLHNYLTNKNYKSNLLHVDKFCNVSVLNNVYTKFQNGTFTSDDLSSYYEQCINTRNLIEAIKLGKEESEILVLEGIFIFKPCLRDLIDFKIFLEVEERQALNRYVARKTSIGDELPIEVFSQIWVASHKMYRKEVNPKQYADLTIFNDFLRPNVETYNKTIQWIAETLVSQQVLQPLI